MNKKIIISSILTTICFNIGINFPILTLILLWMGSAHLLLWLSERKSYDFEDFFIAILCSGAGPFCYFMVRNESGFQDSLKEFGIPKIKFQSPVVFEKIK